MNIALTRRAGPARRRQAGSPRRCAPRDDGEGPGTNRRRLPHHLSRKARPPGAPQPAITGQALFVGAARAIRLRGRPLPLSGNSSHRLTQITVLLRWGATQGMSAKLLEIQRPARSTGMGWGCSREGQPQTVDPSPARRRGFRVALSDDQAGEVPFPNRANRTHRRR